MLNSNMKLTGKLTIVNKGEDGKIKDHRELDNLIVTTGNQWVASRMKDASGAVMSHMAVGSGSASPVAGDTGLGTELARVALDSSTVLGQTITYVATFVPGIGTGALQEAGIFNGSPSGTMLNRVTYSVINKGAGDTMTVTWTVTVG